MQENTYSTCFYRGGIYSYCSTYFLSTDAKLQNESEVSSEKVLAQGDEQLKMETQGDPIASWFWLEIQIAFQIDEPHPTIAQGNEVKEEKGKSPHPETPKTEKRAAKNKKGKENDEKPKPKPHPARSQVRTCVPEMGVDLAMGESSTEAMEPITVGQLFQYTVKELPRHPALKYKEDRTWKTITYIEYYNLCVRAAKSFLKVRVENA